MSTFVKLRVENSKTEVARLYSAIITKFLEFLKSKMFFS